MDLVLTGFGLVVRVRLIRSVVNGGSNSFKIKRHADCDCVAHNNSCFVCDAIVDVLTRSFCVGRRLIERDCHYVISFDRS